MNRLRRYAVAALAVFVIVAPGFAAEYHFDLTNVLGSSGNCFGDCGFDLGTQFSRIDSAELFVRGVFEPGSRLRLGGAPGKISNGIFEEPFDTIVRSIWLGDADTSGFGEIVLGIDFEGIDGSFEQRADFRGIRGLEPNSFGLITYLSDLPADSTDLVFLLDGMGKIQTVTAYSGQYAEPSVLQFDEITLILNGVAVPEPSALALIASVALIPISSRRTGR